MEAATGYSVRLAVKAWDLDPAYVPAGMVAVVDRAVPASCQPLVELPPSEAGEAPLTPPQTASLADEDERALREALKLPRTSSCRTWRRDALEDGDGGSTSEGESVRLVAVGCPACLVSPAHSHGSSRAHSCIMVGRRGGATLCCYTHGNRRLHGAELATVRRSLRELLVLPERGEVARNVQRSDDELSSYERMMMQLEATAQRLSLRKLTGARRVYRQVPGCPCAFEPYMSFTEFIHSVVRGDPDYRANVRRMAELETYMDKYDEAAFPRLVPDTDVLSFQNGVVVLMPSVCFVPYPDASAGDAGYDTFELRGRVARHHIPLPYTGSEATPEFDSILSRQFDEGDGALRRCAP